MLFRRRKPMEWLERLKTSLIPRRSYGRSLRYFSKRVLRLNATPHAIAAGVAAGVFASFTPLLGLHFFIAFALAYILAGNMIAAAIGTFFGNPITFPIIFSLTHRIGRMMQGERPINENVEAIPQIHGILEALDFRIVWEPLIKPMLLGSVPIGLPVALGFYIATRWAVAGFREQRAKRLAKKAKRKALGKVALATMSAAKKAKSV